MDHIVASHFLEHVYWNEALKILKKYRRIRKPDGTLHVIVSYLYQGAAAIWPATRLPGAADAFVKSLIFTETKRPSLLTR